MKKANNKLLTKIAVIAGIALILLVLASLLLGSLAKNPGASINGGTFLEFSVLKDPMSWGYGGLVLVMPAILWLALGKHGKKSSSLLKSAAKGLESALENSRFMTDKERDSNFVHFQWDKAADAKKDGVPVRAVYNEKKKTMEINVVPGAHSLIIGATGSGKTTTFINPMIQILAEAQKGSSMIMTDPKGELITLHSKKLAAMGYDVKILDLRDTYSSYRWNPLESIWDMYQDYVAAGKGIRMHTDSVLNYELKLRGNESDYEGDCWFEYQGAAYATRQDCINNVSVARQKIYDEMYEDLNDLISVICPIESPDDPVWEKGARSIVMATVLAMLEDSENPELGMSKEKFNFFNLNKIIANSEDNFKALKDYFAGRSQLSTAVTLSRQVLSAADNTLSSYMSIAFDKLSMFNDRGLCALTSATDIRADSFADRPTALFMKIPDEKDTRHALASVFILCIYKALIKKASSREDLSLPRNVYFILDEFGNMPKIEKFDKMITVGRSRKIWFNMVVQSYAQLSNVYSENVANIVKSNCGVKIFIGSNDIETCKEFSELCGNMTVSTNSVSSSTGDKSGELNYSTQIQTRPLIYPSELQKLNNATSTGNAIIVTFGNYPLKTKFTLSYQCPLYEIGQMDLSETQNNFFNADEAFYDVALRNRKILGD